MGVHPIVFFPQEPSAVKTQKNVKTICLFNANCIIQFAALVNSVICVTHELG